MHPSVEEQLRAVRRLVDEVAADPALGEASGAALALAAAQLRRLEGSYSARLPFLVADNAATAALLAGLAGLPPDITAAARAVEHDRGGVVDEPTAHARNKVLRGLLARAVHELGDGAEAAAARARIGAHLRERLAADPTLNRPRRTATP